MAFGESRECESEWNSDFHFSKRKLQSKSGDVMPECRTGTRTSNSRAISLSAAALVLTSALSAGCTSQLPLTDGTDRWRVVDPLSTPPEPIGGASVLVMYRGSAASIGHSIEYCNRAVLLKSDADGWVDMPDARGANVEVEPLAYKTGYIWPPRRNFYDLKRREIYLTRWDGVYGTKMNYFRQLRGSTNCAQIGFNGQAIADFADIVIPDVRASIGPDYPEILGSWITRRDLERELAREGKAR
jgi:hypothetical protein